jgi:hypothetical protein
MFSRSLELEEEGMGGGEKGQRSFLFSYFSICAFKMMVFDHQQPDPQRSQMGTRTNQDRIS